MIQLKKTSEPVKMELPAPAIRREEALRYAGITGHRCAVDTAVSAVDTAVSAGDTAVSAVDAAVSAVDTAVSTVDAAVSAGNSEWVLSEDNQALQSLLEECIAEAEKVLEYRVVFCECCNCIVFAATVGMGMDRLIAKYERISPAKAVLMSGLGSERIESLCDAFCRKMREQHPERKLKARVSPGYGKWPLELQQSIFSLLEVTKHTGIVLNDSLFMTPVKSVTAMIYFE